MSLQFVCPTCKLVLVIILIVFLNSCSGPASTDKPKEGDRARPGRKGKQAADAHTLLPEEKIVLNKIRQDSDFPESVSVLKWGPHDLKADLYAPLAAKYREFETLKTKYEKMPAKDRRKEPRSKEIREADLENTKTRVILRVVYKEHTLARRVSERDLLFYLHNGKILEQETNSYGDEWPKYQKAVYRKVSGSIADQIDKFRKALQRLEKQSE